MGFVHVYCIDVLYATGQMCEQLLEWFGKSPMMFLPQAVTTTEQLG